LVRDRVKAAQFARECAEKRFHVVHGVAEDAIRLHTAMAVHDVSAVFHFAGDSDRGLDAVSRAVNLHDSRMPVVTARPSLQLRLADHRPPPVPLGVARFGELFGGGDRKLSRVVPRTITARLTDTPAPAAGGPPRDFVAVRDAARACLTLAEAVDAEGRPLDCTFRSGWSCSDCSMASAVADVFAGRAPEQPDLVPANPFGWRPATTLAAALAETIDWYRQNPHALATTTPAPIRKAA
jgi:hypothetical protein